jgi:hypothetical protein
MRVALTVGYVTLEDEVPAGRRGRTIFDMGSRLPRGVVLRGVLAVMTLLASARGARADFESAKQLFLGRMKSADWKERRGAYGALSDHDGAPAAALILQSAATEAHPAVLEAAAATLMRMGGDGARQAAIAAVRKGKGAERIVGAAALVGKLGADVDALFIEMLSTGPPTLAVLAAVALGQIGRSGTTAPLVAALAHSAPPVRAAAAHSLGMLGDRTTVGPLVERLKSDKGRVRAEIVAALEAITHQKFGDSPGKWAAVAAAGDPATVNEQPALAPSFFGAPVTGERVVFVLDRSLHMRDAHPWADPAQRDRLEALCTPRDGARIPWRQLKTKLQLTVAQLRHVVEGLAPGTKFEVIYFAADVKSVFGLKWTPAGAATRKLLEEALPTIDVDDGINPYDALLAALDLGGATDDKAMKSGPDQIVLVTNNIPTKGDVTDADVVARAIAFRARPRGVAVSVVGLGEHPYTMAEELAKRTGGVYANLSK